MKWSPVRGLETVSPSTLMCPAPQQPPGPRPCQVLGQKIAIIVIFYYEILGSVLGLNIVLNIEQQYYMLNGLSPSAGAR